MERISLEQLNIPAPCHENWQNMSGDAERRFCGRCGKDVHDLSAMSRAAAEGLVAGDDQRLCIRIWRDRRGQVVTRESAPWRGLRSLLLRLRLRRLERLVAVLSLPLVLGGCRAVAGMLLPPPESVGRPQATQPAAPATVPVLVNDGRGDNVGE